MFPSQEQTLATATRMLRNWLERGESPVVLGWRLGKAQELLHHLLSDGFEVVAEEGIYQAVEAYREGGVNFPGRVTAFNGHWPDGTVALFPPGRSSSVLNGYRYQRTMELTGWAVSDNRHHWRRPADSSLPFSDHADYNDLLSYVETGETPGGSTRYTASPTSPPSSVRWATRRCTWTARVAAWDFRWGCCRWRERLYPLYPLFDMDLSAVPCLDGQRAVFQQSHADDRLSWGFHHFNTDKLPVPGRYSSIDRQWNYIAICEG